jgi:maleate cis-trans isomerase
MTYELSTQYDSRASFYGKAKVEEIGTTKKLVSYTTHVASIVRMGAQGSKAIVYGTYSQTTLRHIKEFLKQNGFKAESGKQIMADYGVKA